LDTPLFSIEKLVFSIEKLVFSIEKLVFSSEKLVEPLILLSFRGHGCVSRRRIIGLIRRQSTCA
jgi:hypothetical protein